MSAAEIEPAEQGFQSGSTYVFRRSGRLRDIGVTDIRLFMTGIPYFFEIESPTLTKSLAYFTILL